MYSIFQKRKDKHTRTYTHIHTYIHAHTHIYIYVQCRIRKRGTHSFSRLQGLQPLQSDDRARMTQCQHQFCSDLLLKKEVKFQLMFVWCGWCIISYGQAYKHTVISAMSKWVHSAVQSFDHLPPTTQHKRDGNIYLCNTTGKIKLALLLL